MSYERFIPADGCGGAISETEAAYVSGLIEHAEGRERTPVLTATRSLGRVKGLKAAFPGLHILLYRNLFQQWCSVTDQAVRGNPFFLNRIFDIIKWNQHDSQLRDLLQIFPVETPSVADPATFYLFVFFHLHLYVNAAAAADLVIDVNRLAEDRSYRENAENALHCGGVTADFSAARNSIAYSACCLGSGRGFTDRLSVIGEVIIDRSPDPVGRELGTKLLADLIEEHDRYEFYTKGIRSVLLGPAGSLTMHQDVRLTRDAALAERDAARAERNQLATERDATSAYLNALRAAFDRVAAERERLRRECYMLGFKLRSFVTDQDRSLSQDDSAIVTRGGADAEPEIIEAA